MRLRAFGRWQPGLGEAGKAGAVAGARPGGLTAGDDRLFLLFFSGARCDGYAPAYACELLDMSFISHPNLSSFSSASSAKSGV
ncbi:hypothetical protein QUB47_28185 [Microcoleus sp. AT9_B5]